MGDAVLTVSVNVTNTSDVDGDEVVELYTRDMYASVVPSLKRLKDFTRVSIPAGESKTVTFEITKADLSLVRPVAGENGKFETVTEDGQFKVMIGALSTELEQPEHSWEGFLSRTYKNALSFEYKN